MPMWHIFLEVHIPQENFREATNNRIMRKKENYLASSSFTNVSRSAGFAT